MALLSYNGQYLSYNGKLLDASVYVPPVYTLTALPEYIYYDLDGVPCDLQEFYIDTQASNHWSITSNRIWTTVSPLTGTGSGYVEILVAGGGGATATLTIESDAPTAYVDIIRTPSCL